MAERSSLAPGAATLAEALLHDITFIFVVPHWWAAHVFTCHCAHTKGARLPGPAERAWGVDSGRRRGLSGVGGGLVGASVGSGRVGLERA